MVEVVYRQEKLDSGYSEAGFKLPKNIRQIGDGESDVQIYMEDNVAVYLQRVPDNEENIRYGVLLGYTKISCGYHYIFINGAVDVNDIFDNTVLFGDDTWTTINDSIGRFFSGSKVVGWFLSQGRYDSSQNIWIKKMHLNNFAGMDKVFYQIDREEDDEAFYYYRNDRMERLKCYHIYYERNRNMQNYIEESDADIRLKKYNVYESREGTLDRMIHRKAEEIIEKETEKINKGKMNTKKINDDVSEENSSKSSGRLGRAASYLVMGGLAAAVAVMAVNGKLNNLADGFNKVIKGIVNDNDEPAGDGGIISVNGVPEKNDNNINETSSDGEKGTTSENVSSEETSSEETSSEDMTSEEKTPSGDETKAEETSGEKKTEAETTANVSITPVYTQKYAVQKGDTLYKICMKLYGNTDNMETIIELNNLESGDDIYYGKNLIVP